ncbi:hypothetical protein CLAFUR4_03824 [Fulvia fulva]|nr:hypothetical protein CLAFUR4_03824 [Fulvia fulva]WPV26050.1 hypothetical protein CLAFUW7_03828 [Fulvia fulva]
MNTATQAAMLAAGPRAGQRWTAADDATLLQMREQRQPWRVVAQALQKLPLACRLRMNQITKKRRRAERALKAEQDALALAALQRLSVSGDGSGGGNGNRNDGSSNANAEGSNGAQSNN